MWRPPQSLLEALPLWVVTGDLGRARGRLRVGSFEWGKRRWRLESGRWVIPLRWTLGQALWRLGRLRDLRSRSAGQGLDRIPAPCELRGPRHPDSPGPGRWVAASLMFLTARGVFPFCGAVRSRGSDHWVLEVVPEVQALAGEGSKLRSPTRRFGACPSSGLAAQGGRRAGQSCPER